MKPVVNPPSKRKDTLASGHAVESYGNNDTMPGGKNKFGQTWEDIFGPRPKPRRKKKAK